MKKFRILCGLEIKRNITLLPWLFIRTAIAAFLIFAAIFSYQLWHDEETPLHPITIGLSMENPGKAELLAVSLASSMESVKSLCKLEKCTEEEARKGLRDGTYDAVLYIPEQFVQDIQRGVNRPALISFASHSGISGAALKELAESGAQLLSVAQAAVYALDETLQTYEIRMSQTEMENMVSMVYLRPALSREQFFSDVDCGPFQGVSQVSYYEAVLALTLTLLATLAAGKLHGRQNRHMVQYLYGKGIRPWQRVLAGVLGTMALVLPSFVCFTMALRKAVPYVAPGQWVARPLWLPAVAVSISVSALAYAVFTLARDGGAGCQILFLITVAMALVAGGLVPLGFLPEGISHVGGVLPYSLWLTFLLTGNTGSALWIVLWTAACLCLSIAAERRRSIG